MEEDLQRLVEDFLTQKQILLVQVKKGILSKEQFLREVLKHIEQNYHLPVEKQADLLKEFEQYVFGYSRLSPLMDDGSISDIRVVSHDCIRIKREGKRMDAGIAFASEKEYRQFIDYIATRNQVNISNLNAIQRFTDTESHPDFIFRFTLSMPIVNTYSATGRSQPTAITSPLRSISRCFSSKNAHSANTRPSAASAPR